MSEHNIPRIQIENINELKDSPQILSKRSIEAMSEDED